jgi:type I restriction enzyme, S subunit
MIDVADAMQYETQQLPHGWRWARLGDVCDIMIGRTPRRDNPAYWNGDLPWATISDLNNGTIFDTKEKITALGAQESRSRLLKAGTLLFSFKLTIGKMAYAGVDLYTNEAIAALLPKDANQLSRDFLRFALSSVDAYASSSHAVKGKTLNQETLDAIPIPLPPLAEQQHIATLLTEQMAAVDNARVAAEAQLAAAKELPAAYLRAVFESDEARGWERVLLGDVAQIVGGIQKTPDRKAVSFHRPYLTVRNVQRGYFDLTEVDRFEITPFELERLRLVSGDILIVEGNGSLDHIGRNALFNGEIEDCIHQNHIIRVRLNQETLLANFVSRFLNSDTGKAQMLEKARTTSGLYTLSAGKVASLEVPFPSLAEQQRIATTLTEQMAAVEKTCKALEDQLTTINQVPAALLRRAFSGELTKRPVASIHPQKVVFMDSQQTFFERNAIAAFFIETLHQQPNFGRTELMKAIYLSEAYAGITLNGSYQRYKFGPFDQSIYDLERLANQQGWFSVEDHGSSANYRPGKFIRNRLQAAAVLIGEQQLRMDKLIQIFAGINTRRAEVITTLFAVWNDFLLDGIAPTDDQIVHEFRENWHESKKRFTPRELHEELGWMRANDLTPRGIGPHTEVVHAS